MEARELYEAWQEPGDPDWCQLSLQEQARWQRVATLTQEEEKPDLHALYRVMTDAYKDCPHSSPLLTRAVHKALDGHPQDLRRVVQDWPAEDKLRQAVTAYYKAWCAYKNIGGQDEQD